MKESDLKQTIEAYLHVKYNQGKLYYDRLNSGSILALQGRAKRRIRLCREGTADFVVMQHFHFYDEGRAYDASRVIFLEIKSKGKQSGVQKAFQYSVEAQGAEYHIVKSLEDLQEVLD